MQFPTYLVDIILGILTAIALGALITVRESVGRFKRSVRKGVTNHGKENEEKRR
jgi:MFS superfamily sulfate permease-like transporter